MSEPSATDLSAADIVRDILPVLRSHAAEVDENAAFPEKSIAALRQHRLMSLFIPREYGGGGGSLELCMAVAGELAAACLSTAQIWAMHIAHLDPLIRYGSEEFKKRVLTRAAAEEYYLASVTTEAGRRANLFVADAALQQDNDRYVFERTAPVVTGGAHAEGFVITLRASGESTRHQVTLVYADSDDVDFRATSAWNSMGMRGTESIGAVLTGSVPAGNVIGEPGGFGVVARESIIPICHLTWASCWLGAARGALAGFVGQVAGTEQAEHLTDLFYDRLSRIRLDLELVSGYLTRVREEVDGCRERGGSLSQPALQLHINGLKICASELCFRAVDNLVQLAGLRHGYLKNGSLALERTFRDLRAASLMNSNNEMRVGLGAMAFLDRKISLI